MAMIERARRRAAQLPPAGPPGGGRLDRRGFLVAGAMAVVTVACTNGDSTTSRSGDGAPTTGSGGTTTPPTTSETSAATAASTTETASSALQATDFDGLSICRLLPESTSGPFPLDEQLIRRDITEGLPGHRLHLGLRVVDAGCAPVSGVAVEIWHTDATGDYSAFVDNGSGKDEGPGTTFMRGTQPANEEGIAEFSTIYPGWYEGRTPHIHFRVRLDDTAIFTSQLYFPDDQSALVYTEVPYAEFGPADTTNATDGIAGDLATNGLLLHLSPSPTGGTRALANLGIGVA